MTEAKERTERIKRRRRARSSRLSQRELEVVQLAAEGLTDKEICQRLELNSTTIRTYWVRLRSKLKAVNRAQAVTKVLEMRHASEELRAQAEIERHEQALKVKTDSLALVLADLERYARWLPLEEREPFCNLLVHAQSLFSEQENQGARTSAREQVWLTSGAGLA